MIRTRVFHAQGAALPPERSRREQAGALPRPERSASRPAQYGGHARRDPRRDQRKMSRPLHRPRPPARQAVVTKPITLDLPSSGENIRIIPLGGVEEIGRNMTAVEFEGDIVVIDAGIQFSTEETPGIDYILPNIKYLEERKKNIRALIVTHGHLDHIGGIPYCIGPFGNPPIYTREFGALLIKKRQMEFQHLPPLNFKIVGADDGSMPISPRLKIRFFGLTHSIPDSTGVIIETPYGDLVFTGDVRVENTDGLPAEREKKQYAIFKNRNVLLLAMDSTGIEKPGWSISEQRVVETVDRLVRQAAGRVVIATFASQVERIISFIRTAKQYGRKVVVEGRSMKNNVEIIKHLGLADVNHIVSVDEIENYPPQKLLILATGAQGEEFAALMRIANRTHKQIRLNHADTIILSSSVIPGNERAVTILKDNLFRHDAKIITYLDTDVHTSGHGKRGELEWIHRQIPYRFFIPIHGNHFMLKMHAELARALGAKPENIVVPDNGSIVEITEKGKKIVVRKEKAPSNSMMVDGFAVGDIQEVVIRDRQLLAQDGMFVIIATINSQNGKLRKSPDIISRGFVYLRESQELLRQARFIIKKTVEDTTFGMNPINFDYVKSAVTDKVSEFLFQQTAKRPIVIPVILGV